MIKELIHKIYSEKTIKRIEKKQQLLAKKKSDVYYFLNNRLIICLCIFFAIVFLPYGYAFAILLSILFYYLYEYYYFDYNIKKRRKKLEYQAVDFFENMIVAIENTSNLKGAIKLVSGSIDNELANEFKRFTSEIDMGASIEDAIINMQQRIPSNNINNMLLTFVKPDLKINDLKNSLKRQLDFLKHQLYLNERKRVVKLPIKVTIISIIFILLIVLIINLPVIIDMIKKGVIK